MRKQLAEFLEEHRKLLEEQGMIEEKRELVCYLVILSILYSSRKKYKVENL